MNKNKSTYVGRHGKTFNIPKAGDTVRLGDGDVFRTFEVLHAEQGSMFLIREVGQVPVQQILITELEALTV